MTPLLQERSLCSINILDHICLNLQQEGVTLPVSVQRHMSSLRGHLEDSLTTLVHQSLSSFSKIDQSGVEWAEESKYDGIIDDDYYEKVNDKYELDVARKGYKASQPGWHDARKKKRKVKGAIDPNSQQGKGGGTPNPAPRDGGGKGKGRGGKGKGRGGKGRYSQRGRAKGGWRGRN